MVKFRPLYEGRFADTLECVFNDLVRKESFVIIRNITANAGSSQDHETLKSTGAYVKPKVAEILPGIIVPSLRPSTWTKTQWRINLPRFIAPPSLLRRVFGSDNHNVALRRHLPAVFNANSHGKQFQVLLHIEEETRRLVIYFYIHNIH